MHVKHLLRTEWVILAENAGAYRFSPLGVIVARLKSETGY